MTADEPRAIQQQHDQDILAYLADHPDASEADVVRDIEGISEECVAHALERRGV